MRHRRRLKGGAPQAAALSETKRDFLGGGEYDRPLYWAPFVLYGE